MRMLGSVLGGDLWLSERITQVFLNRSLSYDHEPSAAAWREAHEGGMREGRTQECVPGNSRHNRHYRRLHRVDDVNGVGPRAKTRSMSRAAAVAYAVGLLKV